MRYLRVMFVPDLTYQSANQTRCAIAIMAKSPTAGRVKTRLSPFLTPEEARDLVCCFLKDMTTSLALAARQVAIDPYIAFAPAGSEAAFARLVAPGTRFVLADGSLPTPPQVTGFGRCLYQAAHSLLVAGYGSVGLLNSDSPTLPTSLVVDAAQRMAIPGDRVVLGPSTDGGYYLIVIKRPHAPLFAAVDWSTERVAAQTRMRAQGLGLACADLETWFDVDDPPSLRRLADEIAGTHCRGAGHVPYAAPCTTAWMRKHRIVARLNASAGDPRASAAGS